MNAYISLAAGLVLLIAGGEILVRGAVTTAERLGVSPLLIGLTLVGFGTSAPEMVISVQAAMTGSPGIAIGNFVGSSISNIFLILGLTAILAPIAVDSRALSRDGTFVLITAVLFTLTSLLLPYDPFVGWTFIALLVIYLIYAWQQERGHSSDGHTSAYEMSLAYHEKRSQNGNAPSAMEMRAHKTLLIATPVGVAILGLVVVIAGGRLLVDSAIEIARAWQITETVIGLTIVAVGTSLPELVTCVIAGLKGQPSVAIGNILGSNIYNILAVGGMTAIIAPTTVPEHIIYFDNPVMIAAAVLLIFFARTGFQISRLEGTLLFACYVAYLFVLLPKPASI
jgi:cation:H+ antiporter